jgi:hypothetical protein
VPRRQRNRADGRRESEETWRQTVASGLRSSPHGDHDPCDQRNADDEKAGPDHVVVETRFCHAPSLAAVERTTLIWVKFPRGLSVAARRR